MAMPERIWRSVPEPSSRMNLRSLALLFTLSHALTFTARKSLLQKVSKSTLSWAKGSTSTAGRAALRASACSSSRAASSFSTSMRGNRFSPLLTAAPAGSRPHAPADSQVRAPSSTPSWAKIFPQVSGIKGVSSTAERRTHSSRL